MFRRRKPGIGGGKKGLGSRGGTKGKPKKRVKGEVKRIDRLRHIREATTPWQITSLSEWQEARRRLGHSPISAEELFWNSGTDMELARAIFAQLARIHWR